MTKLICFYGAPSSGKSTNSCKLYASKKTKGENVELVREAAKEWCWENRKIGMYDQMYLISEQIRRESMLFGKVDTIITDSPALLGAFYMEHNHNKRFMTDLVLKYIETAKQNNVTFINKWCRIKQYNPVGRYESKKQALKIQEDLWQFLKRNLKN